MAVLVSPLTSPLVRPVASTLTSGGSGKFVTNLALQSEAFGTSPWSLAEATIVANGLAGPNGLVTADYLVESSNTAVHSTTQNFTAVADKVYTFSTFGQTGSRNYLQLTVDLQSADGFAAVFNVVSGVISKALFKIGAGTSTALLATISTYPGGWFKCSITGTLGGTTGRILLAVSSAASPVTSYPNYAGDGASNIKLWGAQLETGWQSNTYIPTTTVAVTAEV